MLLLGQALPVSQSAPALRALQQAVAQRHDDLAAASEANLHTLRYLCAAGPLVNAAPIAVHEP